MRFGDRIRIAAAALRRDPSGAVPSPNGLPFFTGFPRSGGTPVAPESLAAVVRCVGLYCDAVASLPLAVLKRNADGGAAQTIAFPTLAAWSFPDKELFAANALLTGNGYAILDNAGISTAPAARVVVETDQKTGAVWYRITPVVPSGPARLYRPERIAHLRYRVFADARIGASPLALGRTSVDHALQIQSTARSLFENLAAAGVVLTSPNKISATLAERLKTDWASRFGGGRLGTTAVLGEGLTAERLAVASATDAQLLEFARFSVAEIARLFGVPLQMLGESASLNYATAVELSRTFVISSLRPFLLRIADELSAKLLTPKQRADGLRVEFDTEPLTLSPGKETSEYLTALVNGGIVTPNEARNYLGYPDAADGDALRVPAGAAPVATANANQSPGMA